MHENSVNPITSDEMHGIIRSLSNKKAADLHELTAEHLKHGGVVVADHLRNIANFVIQNGHVPDILKSGIVTPVLKKGKDPSKPTNYRGITVTSVILKVIEKAWLL